MHFGTAGPHSRARAVRLATCLPVGKHRIVQKLRLLLKWNPFTNCHSCGLHSFDRLLCDASVTTLHLDLELESVSRGSIKSGFLWLPMRLACAPWFVVGDRLHLRLLIDLVRVLQMCFQMVTES